MKAPSCFPVFFLNADVHCNLLVTVPITYVDIERYECPVPYHRLITAEMLAWCAGTGRFLFHKDTCSTPQPILDKIRATKDQGES